MEAWETATDYATLTPRQRRQREWRDHEDEIIRKLGVKYVAHAVGHAIHALADPEPTVRSLAEAVESLDRESAGVIGDWSRADHDLGAIREAVRTDPGISAASADRAVATAARAEREALDRLVDHVHGPRPGSILREMLLDRLASLGARIDRPNELGCCRSLARGERP